MDQSIAMDVPLNTGLNVNLGGELTALLPVFYDARYQRCNMVAEEKVYFDLATINAKTVETIFGLSGGLQLVF